MPRPVLLSLLLLASGCASRIPFTHELRLKYDLTEAELTGLQYYMSETLGMTRKAAAGDRDVVRGQLVTRSGHTVEEIIIAGGTPGVAVAVHETGLDVSFEEGTFLRFGTLKSTGSYVLLPAPQGGKNKIEFDGAIYGVDRFPGYWHLTIDKRFLEEIENKRRKLGGRRIDDD